VSPGADQRTPISKLENGMIPLGYIVFDCKDAVAFEQVREEAEELR